MIQRTSPDGYTYEVDVTSNIALKRRTPSPSCDINNGDDGNAHVKLNSSFISAGAEDSSPDLYRNMPVCEQLF